MSRLNSLTLTIYDTPSGVPEYEVEHYIKPTIPLTPAEVCLYHMMNLLESMGESDEDHTQNETNNRASETSVGIGPPSESLCTGLQRGQQGPLGLVGGGNVIALQSRTERSRGTLDT